MCRATARKNGIVRDLSILENGSLVTLDRFQRGPLLDHGAIRRAFDVQRRDLHIKMGDECDLITSLSGGNQQKVVLAKWLTAGAEGADLR